MNRVKYFGTRSNFLVVATAVLLSPVVANVSLAAQEETVQHYKMFSTLEYVGKENFRNQAEALFTARKQLLSNGKVRYFISPNGSASDSKLIGEESESPFNDISLIVDKRTKEISGFDKALSGLQRQLNLCAGGVTKVTKDNIGKTWKQSFENVSLGGPYKTDIKFTVTALQLKTKTLGDIIAVRALSEPFVINMPKKSKGTGPFKAKVNALYLFDAEMEDIYLGASVCEASTSVNGFKESLRYEVATYMTDAAGVSVDLTGLNKKFEKFAQKVGLNRKALKVKNKEASFPYWAQANGFGINCAQTATICAAVACEGAPNPVAVILMPASQTLAMQSLGAFGTAGGVGTVSSVLTTGVSGIGAMKIAAGPQFLGMGLGTVGAIAGGSAGIAAGAGGGGGGSSARSPSNP